MNKILKVNIGDLEHFQELLDEMKESIAKMYKDGKPGIYTITKESGTNQKLIKNGFTVSGFSYGIVKGLGVRIENAKKWFNTSTVNDFKWTSDTTGEFKTLNSVYKFTYKPEKESEVENGISNN